MSFLCKSSKPVKGKGRVQIGVHRMVLTLTQSLPNHENVGSCSSRIS